MRPLTATSLALAFILGGAGIVAPAVSQAQVGLGIGVSVGVAPPPLPYYEQPSAPGYGYIWTPGYWAWSDYEDDYYWVPGTWVLPPRVGFLWTPPWWGWNDGVYVFNAGYWGPEVGFYGGINYGFGYTGYGYEGGYWRGGDFYYNREVNNITNVNITNVYDRPVRTAGGFNRVSFNGPGGVQARPTNAQVYAARAPHLAPTPMQQQHFQLARTQPALRASVNHGAPPIAATARPAVLRGPEVTPAVRAGGAYQGQARPARGPGVPGDQRYRQGPVVGSERLNGGYRAAGGYAAGGYGGADHQVQPRSGQTPYAPQARAYGPTRGPAGYGGAYDAARRPAPAAPERYSSGPYRAPVRDYGGYGGGYRSPPRAPEALNGGYRPPPRPPQAFENRGGFRAPPQAMERGPAPMMRETRGAPPVTRETRPASPEQRDRREPPR